MVTDVKNLVDNFRKVFNFQGQRDSLVKYCWNGKPEGSPAFTHYPNLVSEIVFAPVWFGRIAEAANVSMNILTAVMEDEEELNYMEFNGITQFINYCESSQYAASMEYLASPSLSVVSPWSNKGRYRLRRLEALLESSMQLPRERRDILFEGKAKDIISTMKDGYCVYYAAYRWAAGRLSMAIQNQARASKKEILVRTRRMTGDP